MVLFVGRIDPIKGIDTLIDAAEILRLRSDRSSRRRRFVIVGGDLDADGEPVGPLADVAESIARRGIAASFRLVGSQPQDQLPLFYAAADVVAVPSRYESFGLVAVEALACGMPVVASRAGGLRFTIDEGDDRFAGQTAVAGSIGRRRWSRSSAMTTTRSDGGRGAALGRAL